MLANKIAKKSQVVALPDNSENAQQFENGDEANLSQKALIDLEKTGTRYGNGFNLNKESKTPLKKSSIEQDKLFLSPEDKKQQD